MNKTLNYPKKDLIKSQNSKFVSLTINNKSKDEENIKLISQVKNKKFQNVKLKKGPMNLNKNTLNNSKSKYHDII